MEYYRTYWQHDDDYHVWIYSEIDNHRYDTRRIEIFRICVIRRVRLSGNGQ